MDAVDVAQIEQDRSLELAINQHRSQHTVKDSADNCIECGQQIPSERQIAKPGVDTCVFCQTLIEKGRL